MKKRKERKITYPQHNFLYCSRNFGEVVPVVPPKLRPIGNAGFRKKDPKIERKKNS
jgi:hypothetical protein